MHARLGDVLLGGAFHLADLVVGEHSAIAHVTVQVAWTCMLLHVARRGAAYGVAACARRDGEAKATQVDHIFEVALEVVVEPFLNGLADAGAAGERFNA